MEYSASRGWMEQKWGFTPGPVYKERLTKMNIYKKIKKMISIISNHRERRSCGSHTLLRCGQSDFRADGAYMNHRSFCH